MALRSTFIRQYFGSRITVRKFCLINIYLHLDTMSRQAASCVRVRYSRTREVLTYPLHPKRKPLLEMPYTCVLQVILCLLVCSCFDTLLLIMAQPTNCNAIVHTVGCAIFMMRCTTKLRFADSNTQDLSL